MSKNSNSQDYLQLLLSVDCLAMLHRQNKVVRDTLDGLLAEIHSHEQRLYRKAGPSTLSPSIAHQRDFPVWKASDSCSGNCSRGLRQGSVISRWETETTVIPSARTRRRIRILSGYNISHRLSKSAKPRRSSSAENQKPTYTLQRSRERSLSEWV